MVYSKRRNGITAEIQRDEVSFMAGLLSEYVRNNRHGDHVPKYNYLANEFLECEKELSDE